MNSAPDRAAVAGGAAMTLVAFGVALWLADGHPWMAGACLVVALVRVLRA